MINEQPGDQGVLSSVRVRTDDNTVFGASQVVPTQSNHAPDSSTKRANNGWETDGLQTQGWDI